MAVARRRRVAAHVLAASPRPSNATSAPVNRTTLSSSVRHLHQSGRPVVMLPASRAPVARVTKAATPALPRRPPVSNTGGMTSGPYLRCLSASLFATAAPGRLAH